MPTDDRKTELERLAKVVMDAGESYFVSRLVDKDHDRYEFKLNFSTHGYFSGALFTVQKLFTPTPEQPVVMIDRPIPEAIDFFLSNEIPVNEPWVKT